MFTFVIFLVTACTLVALRIGYAHGQLQPNITETRNVTFGGPDLFPFGNSTGDFFVPPVLDASSQPLTLSEPFKFFGKEYRQIIVNSNGILSFGETSFTEYQQRPFPFISPPLIAPYWFDFDVSSGGYISYRVSNDSELLNEFNSFWIDLDVTDLIDFHPIQLFIATWDEVPVYSADPFTSANTFQVVLATDTLKTVAVFIYNEINQGPGAQVGFNYGDGFTFYMLPEALSNQTLDLEYHTNSGKAGVFAYRIDNLGQVECSTTITCTTADLGSMTARDCCIGHPDGLAYTISGSEECYVCIVFGWYNDSYTGVEQEASHELLVGYQKGAEQLALNLVFTISPSTANDILFVPQAFAYEGYDFEISSTDAFRVQYSDTDPVTVSVTFTKDDVALEFNELTTLVLESVGTNVVLTGEGVFFRNELDIIIVDSDELDISLSNDEFQITEASQSVTVKICKDKVISEWYYIDLLVTAKTVDIANISGVSLPEIPADNPYAPNRADNQDFQTNSLCSGLPCFNQHVYIDPDEYATTYNCLSVDIPVEDDDINEADQVFVINIEIVPIGAEFLFPFPEFEEQVDSIHDRIHISRNVSLVWIIDDDSIAFGFEETTYTFVEPPLEDIRLLFLVREDNHQSEQTFNATFELSFSNNSIEYQQATNGLDYLAKPVSFQIIYPNTTQVPYQFTLFADNVPENDEEFSVYTYSSIDDRFPSYSQPTTLSSQASIIIINSEDTIGFSQSILTVRENDGVVQITIFSYVFSYISPQNLTLNLTTYDIGAMEGLDYVGVFQRPVVFVNGTVSTTIDITILDDDLAEGVETFMGELVVSGPVNLITTIIVEILDNEDIAVCGNLYEGKNCSENSLCSVSSNGRNIISCECINGYHGSGFICRDVDECANGQDLCDPNANCTNIKGSYKCHCKDGFIGNGIRCLDASNEVTGPCDNNDDNCECFNSTTSGEVECACLPGFKVKTGNGDVAVCQDINECTPDRQICTDQLGTCKNTDGSYECYCPFGYSFDSTVQDCVDLDECKLGTDMCNVNAKCTNTIGSYTCSCNDDYYGDGYYCRTAQQCKRLTDSEVDNCGCLNGLYFELITGECEDVDECDPDLSSVCNVNAKCTNTHGSYTCECYDGFQGSGIICNDIDECDIGTHDCDDNANCNNTLGSFECTCKPLYYGDGKKCESGIAPEISLNSRTLVRPNHNLSYIIGENFCLEDSQSFPNGVRVNCSLANSPVPSPRYIITINKIATDGTEEMLQSKYGIVTEIFVAEVFLDSNILFPLFDNDTKIVNITCQVYNSYGSDNMTSLIRTCSPSECQDGVTNNCSQICTRNDLTGYECSCESGYVHMNDSCLDIDECHNDNSTHNCSEVDNQVCRNTIGSFECDCVPGFQKQDGECEDIKECNEMPTPCSENEQCIELLGNYTCECKSGYSRVGQICMDTNECANETFSYCSESNNMECFNTPGSYFCECMKGYMAISDNLCEDVNECDEGSFDGAICSQQCQNTNGSFYCYCLNGYYLNTTDNSTCHDIDECNDEIYDCPSNSECINTLGSFMCLCIPPYVDNGESCQLSESATIGFILGSISFILIIGIVLVLIFICYYVQRFRHRKPDENVNSIADDEQPIMKSISVQSSFKLKLPPHLIVPSSGIKLVETIGQGEFGIVYKGYMVKNGETIFTDVVAIKTLKGFYDKETVREMLKESSKMYKFDHPNVLTLTGVCLDGGPAPFIIMPFMANGSLLAYLKKNRASLIVACNDDTEEVESVRKQLLDMCIQVARGMEYLARMKVVHRDLAARNCMIDMNFVIKVADFGLSESVGTKDYFRQEKSAIIKLPLKWLAPESIEDYVFSEKSDVWAYGITCWEIFSGGKVPYPGVDLTELPTLLANGHRLNRPKNDACSDDIYTVMMSCWEYEPNDRPLFSSLVDSLSLYLETMAEYMDIGGSRLKSASRAKEVNVLANGREELIISAEKDSVELRSDMPEVKGSSLEASNETGL